MATLSIRITSAERIKLKAQGQAYGFNNLTDFVRSKLGLKPRSDVLNLEAEKIPSLEVVDLEDMMPLLVKMADMILNTDNNVAKLCVKHGVVRIREQGQQAVAKKLAAGDEGFTRG